MNKPVDPSVDGFIRYRLDLAYDGTYGAWQYGASTSSTTDGGAPDAPFLVWGVYPRGVWNSGNRD